MAEEGRLRRGNRLAWGAGDIGGPLRKIAAGNPAAIHVLDALVGNIGTDRHATEPKS
jgi:hypothetical protein